MELEIEQEALKRDQLRKEIAYWNEVLQKAEKYERLLSDEDFKSVLKDLEAVVNAHQSQIEIGLESFSELDPVKLKDAQHIVFIHQMKKEYVQKAMQRPKEVVDLAKMARKNIPELEDQLRHLQGDHHAD